MRRPRVSAEWVPLAFVAALAEWVAAGAGRVLVFLPAMSQVAAATLPLAVATASRVE